MKRDTGTGLVEVLISLFLSSLLLVILMNQYVHVKRHYIRLLAMIADDQDVQQAADILRNSIRQAGFTPCLRSDHYGIPALIAGESLQVNRMSPDYNDLVQVNDASRLEVSRHYLFHQGQSILIADCYHAEIHRVADVLYLPDRQIVALDNPLLFAYRQPAYVGAWLEERFMMGKKGGLYYQSERKDQLASAVRSMHVKHDGSLVSIVLGLTDEASVTIEARVRAT